MEEVEEATTSSQGTIDEEMSVEKQNKESEKDKKDKKDKKKKKKKSKKEKKRKDETQKEKKRRERQDTDAWQKYMDIEDFDTVALAKFIEDVSEPLARAKKTGKRTFLDLCGGAGDVARRAENRHDQIGLGMDWKQGPIRVDLKKPCIYNYIELEIVEEGLAGSAMLHNPCETWRLCPPAPLRDRKEHIWGFPGLSVKDQMKLEEGNQITRACLKYRDLFRRHHVPCALENGDLSMLWAVPEVAEEMHCAKVLKVSYCMMGKPFRKTTRLVVWSVKNEAMFFDQAEYCYKEYFCTSPGGVCKRTGKKHLVLREASCAARSTQWGEKFPRQFANVIAKVLCS